MTAVIGFTLISIGFFAGSIMGLLSCAARVGEFEPSTGGSPAFSSKRSPASGPGNHGRDDLDAARGVIYAAVLGVVLWGVIALLVMA